MKNNILYISGWYPTRLNHTLGNFVFKHAECASNENNVRVIHICTDVNLKDKVEKTTSETPFLSTVIYLPISKNPIFGKIINYFKIIRLYFSEYEKMVAEGFVPDLVHANVVFPIGIVAWLYRRKFGVNYIISEHWTGYHAYADPRPNFIQRIIMRKVANKALFVLPVSDDLGKSMKLHHIVTPMITVPNVVDTDLYLPNTHRGNDSKIKIIHISTLENVQKNITLLLNAFAKIESIHPNAELHFVTDGNLNDYTEEMNHLKIAENIVNHGRQDVVGVAKILQDAAFFVLTSNFENLPCVLIESISCGVPVISTNVGGVSEIVNIENGILINPNNLEELVEAMEVMIERYTTYNKANMHQSAVEKYSYQAIGSQLTHVYNQCIWSKKSQHD